MVTQQYPNSFGRPETVLRAPYTPGDGVLHVRDLPIGVAFTGPAFQVKIETTLYYITDWGPYPHIDWSVPDGAVELTTDASHITGRAVYLELTRAALEALRFPDYVTKTDQTANGFPNAVSLDSLSLADLASAHHVDLDDVDPNQHHYQFHTHGSDLEGTTLTPLQVFVQGIFALSGNIVIPEITVDQDDFQPDGGDEASIWYLSSDASHNISGIDAPQASGVLRILSNIGTFDLTFTHEDSASFIDHRWALPGGVTYTLGPGHSVWAWYDDNFGKWRIVS